MSLKRFERIQIWLGAGALLLTGVIVGAMSVSPKVEAENRLTPLVELDNHQQIDSLSTAFRETAKAVSPAVVSITNAVTVERDTSDVPEAFREMPEIEDFFRRGPMEDLFREHRERLGRPRLQPSASMKRGIGTGVVIDSSGIILTNNHVVAGGDAITVRLHDGREFKATEVIRDAKTDLAIVKIENATDLVAARLGDSDNVYIGDWVLALGQPFGLQGTVTAGIISAKDRGIGITQRGSYLQTDAAINPGNSGGPLVNLRGEVIGINTAISSSSGGNQGIGFAIPVNLARWVSEQLVSSGKVNRSFLGVGIQTVTPEVAKRFQLTTNTGVLVTEVRTGTPAEKAGLRLGDVITRFGGKAVKTPRQLQLLVERTPAGNAQMIDIIRDGKAQKLGVEVTALPGEQVVTNRPALEVEPTNWLGVTVGSVDSAIGRRLGGSGSHGVVVTDVARGSLASQAGIRPGMVIAEIDRQPIKSTEHFEQALNNADVDRGVLLLVRTAQGSKYVVLER